MQKLLWRNAPEIFIQAAISVGDGGMVSELLILRNMVLQGSAKFFILTHPPNGGRMPSGYNPFRSLRT